jgi:hypothetical protein
MNSDSRPLLLIPDVYDHHELVVKIRRSDCPSATGFSFSYYEEFLRWNKIDGASIGNNSQGFWEGSESNSFIESKGGGRFIVY